MKGSLAKVYALNLREHLQVFVGSTPLINEATSIDTLVELVKAHEVLNQLSADNLTKIVAEFCELFDQFKLEESLDKIITDKKNEFRLQNQFRFNAHFAMDKNLYVVMSEIIELRQLEKKCKHHTANNLLCLVRLVSFLLDHQRRKIGTIFNQQRRSIELFMDLARLTAPRDAILYAFKLILSLCGLFQDVVCTEPLDLQNKLDSFKILLQALQPILDRLGKKNKKSQQVIQALLLILSVGATTSCPYQSLDSWSEAFLQSEAGRSQQQAGLFGKHHGFLFFSPPAIQLSVKVIVTYLSRFMHDLIQNSLCLNLEKPKARSAEYWQALDLVAFPDKNDEEGTEHINALHRQLSQDLRCIMQQALHKEDAIMTGLAEEMLAAQTYADSGDKLVVEKWVRVDDFPFYARAVKPFSALLGSLLPKIFAMDQLHRPAFNTSDALFSPLFSEDAYFMLPAGKMQRKPPAPDTVPVRQYSCTNRWGKYYQVVKRLKQRLEQAPESGCYKILYLLKVVALDQPGRQATIEKLLATCDQYTPLETMHGLSGLRPFVHRRVSPA